MHVYIFSGATLKFKWIIHYVTNFVTWSDDDGSCKENVQVVTGKEASPWLPIHLLGPKPRSPVHAHWRTRTCAQTPSTTLDSDHHVPRKEKATGSCLVLFGFGIFIQSLATALAQKVTDHQLSWKFACSQSIYPDISLFTQVYSQEAKWAKDNINHIYMNSQKRGKLPR